MQIRAFAAAPHLPFFLAPLPFSSVLAAAAAAAASISGVGQAWLGLGLGLGLGLANQVASLEP